MSGDDLDAIEREVRRRLADLLASAGVDQGRISQEILWQLPPEFVRAYKGVWDRSLRPDLQSGLQGTPGPLGQKARNAPDSKTGGRTRQGWASGAKHGKRYSTHWVVGDERLFRIKGSVDRKLRRLAAQMEEALRDRTITELEGLRAGGRKPTTESESSSAPPAPDGQAPDQE